MIGELTNHLWQSTIFAVVAGLLAVAFRKNRAQVRYWLWLSASFKFLIPFSLLISLGNSLRDAMTAGKIATEIAPLAVWRTMVQITNPFPDTLMFVPSAPHRTSWIPIAIVGVWACGFAAITLMRFRGCLRIRAALRASTPIEIPTTVAVRSSQGLLEPGIVGLLRPILILPEGVLKNLTPSQLEAVLAHELSHVRRRDNLTAAIHMIVEAIFWFHPLVWWIGARLVEERERACDEAVLSLGSEPREYADAILSLCRLYVESPLPCASGIGGYDLKRRIVHIMEQQIAEKLSSGGKVLLGGAAAAAIAIPLALGMIGASKARAQKTQAGDVPLPMFETASIKLSGREERVETASDELQAFMGTWRGQEHGQPTVTLALKNVGTEIAGSIIFYLYQDGKLVEQDEVQLLTPKLQADTLNFSLPQVRVCAGCHAGRRPKGLVRVPQNGDVLSFAMKLVGHDQAWLRTLGVPASEFSLQKLTRRK